MRPLILLSFLMLSACGGGGLARGGDAPTCASVASKQKAVDRIDKDYEELRQRIVDSPTEKNQQKLADMATESTAFSRNQIMVQAGTSMLAQANQSQQGVLQLLR